MLAACAAAPAYAKTREDCLREYTPQRGQEGKDVIWAPTEDPMVVPMLSMAKVTSADKLYDLGSGDGKLPIAAAKLYGATAVGIEYDAGLVKHAQCLVAAEGVEHRVTMIEGDIFEADFSDATVVTLYLLPALNLRLRPTLLAMKPGTRVVSYSFTMGEWDPDEFVDLDGGAGSAYLWIVPTQAAGTWTFRSEATSETFKLTLEQTFQKLAGETDDGERVTGKLLGTSIALALARGANPPRLTGTVDGERIDATVVRGGEALRFVGTRE